MLFQTRWTRVSSLLAAVCLTWTLLALANASLAWGAGITVQAPAGGSELLLPGGRVACSESAGTWSVSSDRRSLRPPSSAPVGQRTQLPTASSLQACDSAERSLLIVTGPFPQIELQSVSFEVESGRLRLQGKGLTGATFRLSNGKTADACLSAPDDKCQLALDRSVSADPSKLRIQWAPAGGSLSGRTYTFDASGRPLAAAELELSPGRILVSRLLSRMRTLDLSDGHGAIPLVHPGAVAAVSCTGAQCQLTESAVLIREVPVSSKQISVKLELAPRVLLARGPETQSVVVRNFDIARCDLQIASGQPIRSAESTRLLVVMPERCGAEVERLRFSSSAGELQVQRWEIIDGQVYVLLGAPRLSEADLTVTVLRAEDDTVLALAEVSTQELPPTHSTFTLPGFGEIDFIPKNRAASVALSTVNGGKLVPLSVPGAYEVDLNGGKPTITGISASAGFTNLRISFRVAGVPAAFSAVDFAVVNDPLQRPIREANLPIALGASSSQKHAVVELHCLDAAGKLKRLAPGTSPHIPFEQRDSCRLTIHKSRIPTDSGEQLVDVEVSVVSAAGSERGEARLDERLLLRHGSEREVIWIRGAKQQFDRINIRVHHVVEESRYLVGHGARYRLPSAQWSVVTEDADLKFYATATIPSGLFRFSDDPQDLGTGPLALNFGVLSRLTWLNSDGSEGLIGLESGVMGMGLATEKNRQLAVVGGIGIGVPLGNVNQPTQASLNIHAWAAYSLGDREGQLTNPDGTPAGSVELNPWAFVFGPSITIGSIAALL